ncbi:MAG TPA: CaiB/BaiF CoA-transferase family protein [Burkholderiaceae bacterium]|nr:CaiB/BaiF CoA-transferase family protein [Burkholderiaceae bacterium]
MDGPLSHVRVLDLSRILAGPWAGQLLADLGAEVIKIERPGRGDDTRAWGPPFLKDADGGDTTETAYFLCANRGKKSLTLDIASAEGQQIVRELAAQSDVVIENFKTGDLSRYRLGYDDLKEIKPDIVYCSITGFGQSGPMKSVAGYDFMVQGLGGLMSLTGEPDDVMGGGPKKVGVPVADLMTGMYASVAILAALMRRDRTGQGEYIDMALLDCQIAMLSNQAQNYLISREVPKRYGNAHPNVVPYQSFKTADGHVILAIGNDGQFSKFCEVAGIGAVSVDERFSTNAGRVRNREALVEILLPVLVSHTTDYWCKTLGPLGVPCGPINNLEQAFDEEQVKHRGMEILVDHPSASKVPLVGNPIRYRENPIEYGAPPPLLGEHTQQVLTDVLGLDELRLASLRSAGVI